MHPSFHQPAPNTLRQCCEGCAKQSPMVDARHLSLRFGCAKGRHRARIFADMVTSFCNHYICEARVLHMTADVRTPWAMDKQQGLHRLLRWQW